MIHGNRTSLQNSFPAASASMPAKRPSSPAGECPLNGKTGRKLADRFAQIFAQNDALLGKYFPLLTLRCRSDLRAEALLTS